MTDWLRDCFNTFTREAFRLETLQAYNVPQEAELIASWRRGEPQPERSPATSPWLARIAAGVAGGKAWRRVHVVQLPLSEYLQWELEGYVQSQDAGEEIRLVDRRHVNRALHDFWLFDREIAVDMRYDGRGRFIGGELVSEPARITRRCTIRDEVWAAGVPLNDWLATQRRQSA
jgi:hypothetical protein